MERHNFWKGCVEVELEYTYGANQPFNEIIDEYSSRLQGRVWSLEFAREFPKAGDFLFMWNQAHAELSIDNFGHSKFFHLTQSDSHRDLYRSVYSLSISLYDKLPEEECRV